MVNGMIPIPNRHTNLPIKFYNNPKADIYKYPSFVIVDLSWTEQYDDQNFWLFQYFPVKKIIEIILRTPYYQDLYDPFWEEFYKTVGDIDIDSKTENVILLIIETLAEQLHNEFESILGREIGLDYHYYYVFHGWVNDNLAMLIDFKHPHKDPVPCLKSTLLDEHPL